MKSGEDPAKARILAAFRELDSVTSNAFETGEFDNAELPQYARDKAVGGVTVTLTWYKQARARGGDRGAGVKATTATASSVRLRP
ncbi:hypothetical protein [Streptomyces sp. NPDC002044]|uniref:hypothetical protein n=1 Tax=Streptomyces sp. NPDC002044 TaxID=3154662 RepID=UPI00332FB130